MVFSMSLVVAAALRHRKVTVVFNLQWPISVRHKMTPLQLEAIICQGATVFASSILHYAGEKKHRRALFTLFSITFIFFTTVY